MEKSLARSPYLAAIKLIFRTAQSRSRIGVCTAAASLLAACAPTDYSAGVTAFSQAVTQASSTDQTLATAVQQARLNQWTQQVQKANATSVSIDFNKCIVDPSAYHPGDCTVQWTGGPAPLVSVPSPMAGLTKYAALLSSVVTDSTCATLQSDASSLAGAVSDMAKDAKDTGLASAASPLATAVSAIGCLEINDQQLTILRQATNAANPIIAKLVPLIAANDDMMLKIVIEDDARQLQEAEVSYNATKASDALRKMVALSQAIDKAQQSPPGQTVTKLATLHQTLTSDLAAQTVTLARVQSDAQAFITDAQNVQSAVQSLKAAGAPTSSSAKK